MKISIVLTIFIMTVVGCTTTTDQVPTPTKLDALHSSPHPSGSIIAYGSLLQNSIVKPTRSYSSSFGDGYCMKEDIAITVDRYILGTGPKLLNFELHGFNSCLPVVSKIGFGKAFFILERSEPNNPSTPMYLRKSFNIRNDIDGAEGITDPLSVHDLLLIYGQDESILTTLNKPIRHDAEGTISNYVILRDLESRGILSFEKISFTSNYGPADNVEYSVTNDYFRVMMQKVVNNQTLFDYEF